MKKVISTEKIPIKLWLDDIEDGALEQAKNLANLPFVYKWISVMPDSHQGYGMPIGGVLATKDVIIPNAVGVDIGCFSGETKVPLLSGSEKTLKELTKEKEPFYVYSINENKEITGSLAISKKTRINTEVMLVILDNGEKIKCTPDHQFMLRSGQYTEAMNLKAGDSLMPLYRKYDKDNYESVYNPRTKTYQKTHWQLARTGVLGNIPSFNGQKTIIHHRDFNQRNNNPDNLNFNGDKDHTKYHRSIVERNTFWQSPDFEKKRIAGIKYKIKNDKEYLKKKQEQGTENIVKYMKENRNDFLSKVKDNGKRGAKFLIKYNKSEKGRKKSSEIGKKYGFGGDWNKNNHKVVSIKRLNKKEDVYCLTVEKYHNFALSSGVFVHNCGMCAVKTSLTDINVETLKKIMGEIREAVPVGFNHHKNPQAIDLMPSNRDEDKEFTICDKEFENARKQLGTLGGGNHFIEIQQEIIKCIYCDKGRETNNSTANNSQYYTGRMCGYCQGEYIKKGHIWIMIHSGSRNFGKQVADHYNKLAVQLNEKWHSSVPKSWELAFLPIDSEDGQAYIREMNYCVDFAFANRKLMMDRIMNIFSEELMKYYKSLDQQIAFNEMINIAHNYASLENHFGENVWVHRKGATLAREGTIGIIPGSQGSKSYIVKGLGNKESFESCSHGAGRRIGRKEAERTLDWQKEAKELDDKGILHAIRGKKDVDEAPSAYKNIDAVMDNQKDLVEILVELKPLAVIKG